MSNLTKKCFDILHQKMLASQQYKAGYEHGRSSIRELFEHLSISDLRTLRSEYINIHTQYTAGLARVCLELIYEKSKNKGAAA